MIDNNFYIKRAAKIIVLFILVVVMISSVFIVVGNVINPKKQIEKPTVDNTIKKDTTDNNPQTDKIDENSIKKHLAGQNELTINSLENFNEWVIVTVSPKNSNLEPALLIYKKTGNLYKKVIGPGTSFSKENLQFIGIPDNVINSDKVKNYVNQQ